MMTGNETATCIVLILTAGVTISRVAKAWLARGPRRDSARDAVIEQRLARIEQAVEAVAVEVERVAEGQRFTAKLLAERPRVPEAAASRGGGEHDY